MSFLSFQWAEVGMLFSQEMYLYSRWCHEQQADTAKSGAQLAA